VTEPTPNPEPPAGPHPDATAALPGFARRHASVVVVLVVGAAAAGYLYGIRPTPRPGGPTYRAAPPAEGGVPPAVTYRELPDADLRPNSGWASDVRTLLFDRPRPTDPVYRTEEMKLEALADRARNRAFDTAPPTVPHPVDQRYAGNCLACHGPGLRVNDKLATKVSHPWLANCTQCHVEGANPALARFDNPLTESGFVGVARSGPGGRAAPGAPPTVPHPTWMRQDCTSCHGTLARPGIRTTHPWLANCTQCHAPSAALDQVGFPLPSNEGKLP
jgi:cytochrome c-type protein NapB